MHSQTIRGSSPSPEDGEYKNTTELRQILYFSLHYFRPLPSPPGISCLRAAPLPLSFCASDFMLLLFLNHLTMVSVPLDPRTWALLWSSSGCVPHPCNGTKAKGTCSSQALTPYFRQCSEYSRISCPVAPDPLQELLRTFPLV